MCISESGSSELRNALFEASLFGTGIVKGPFNYNKTLNRWTKEEDGERKYSPIDVRVPRIEFVSIWDFFPDPAATSIEDCEYVFHRHKMNKSQLRALLKMPYFNEDAIRDCMMLGPNYVEKDYEYELKDDQRMSDMGSSRFDVLEYGGLMDAEYSTENDMDLPDDVDTLDEIQGNAWICNGCWNLCHNWSNYSGSMVMRREQYQVPQVQFQFRENGEFVTRTTSELFDKKRVVIFSLPGAFTPTCSAYHLPGFEEKYDEFACPLYKSPNPRD